MRSRSKRQELEVRGIQLVYCTNATKGVIHWDANASASEEARCSSEEQKKCCLGKRTSSGGRIAETEGNFDVAGELVVVERVDAVRVGDLVERENGELD